MNSQGFIVKFESSRIQNVSENLFIFTPINKALRSYIYLYVYIYISYKCCFFQNSILFCFTSNAGHFKLVSDKATLPIIDAAGLKGISGR